MGAALCALACWGALWVLRTYWNPLFFFGLWTSATIFVRTLAGDEPLPWHRQLALMALSIPLWWWFELVNSWVHNWEYHSLFEYGPLEYNLLATLTFSTVVPALDAAWRLALRIAVRNAPGEALPEALEGRRGAPPGPFLSRTSRNVPTVLVIELTGGLITQVLVIAAPAYFYPLVWVAPFLVLDALVGMRGKPNFVRLIQRREWTLPLAVGLAGLGCGFFWEFWNFWASPKWTYTIPFVQVLPLFEMPLLGYGGYVPFAWSVYQLVSLLDDLLRRWSSHSLMRASYPRVPGS